MTKWMKRSMEDSEEEKVDLDWKRKFLGTLRVEIKAEKDLKDMPNFFRCCRSLRDGFDGSLYMENRDDYELVKEVLKAEKQDMLDVWIMKLDVAKKRKKVAFVSAYHQEFSLHSDEESDKE